MIIFKLPETRERWVFRVATMDFSNRSNKKELLDQPDIPAEDIRRNMYELSIINQKLGGHAVTWQGFAELAGKKNHYMFAKSDAGVETILKPLEKNHPGNMDSHLPE